MSKFQFNNKVLGFNRKFDLLDDNYVAYEFAWPVEVIECYANKIEKGTLDSLAEATLELLNVPNTSSKKAAELLGVGTEIINAIVKDLSNKGLYIFRSGSVTEAGKNYIDTKESDGFKQEKVFGNMFVSRIDGEVFPYFYEGKLPWRREFVDLLYLSFDEEVENPVEGKRTELVDKVNRAYYKYGQIAKSSQENVQFRKGKEIDFIEEELIDSSFNELEKEPETLADKEETRKLKNARIKVLKTKPKEAYIRCRVSVSKTAPDRFIVDSPFQNNITSWYSECFHRMSKNNESLYVDNETEQLIETFCENVTKQFYIDFPEMQAHDFMQMVKINYPEMISSSIREACFKKYKELFNYNLLCNKGQIGRTTVMTESTKALEMILNCYVAKTKKSVTIDQYRSKIGNVDDARDMLAEFGIDECDGYFSEKSKADVMGSIIRGQSIIGHFTGAKSGHSIVEKYYYLIADAYFYPKSCARKLLIDKGNELIKQLDFINKKRNKIGAHNDGTEPVDISDQDYKAFQEYFKNATRLLLAYYK